MEQQVVSRDKFHYLQIIEAVKGKFIPVPN
jgi:hypothetical protein